MALISQVKTGRKDGGFTRIVGDPGVGSFLSQMQGAVIASGIELEKIIIENSTRMMSEEDFNDFMQNNLEAKGNHVLTKSMVEKMKLMMGLKSNPDFIIVCNEVDSRKVFLVELKDGDQFDTKKVLGEITSYKKFAAKMASVFKEKGIDFPIDMRFCCFNQGQRVNVEAAFKKKLKGHQCWTGRDLCRHMGVDYDDVVRLREKHQKENLMFYFSTATIQMIKSGAAVSVAKIVIKNSIRSLLAGNAWETFVDVKNL